MSPDYETDFWVRRLRLLGWSLTLVMAVGMLLALSWKIAQVSERRAQDATREHLAASLNSLAAEHLAKDKALDLDWRKKNPFVLLRWQQDNYCGELAAATEPQSGCWYWLPSEAWVMHRARFADGWTKGQGEVRAWRVLVVPAGMPTASQSAGAAFALELEAVTAVELSAAGY